MSHFTDFANDYNDKFFGEDDHDDTIDPNYDDHDDFYADSMDGDHDSAMTSAGWGTDEDYGHFCDDEAYGFYGDDYDYIGDDF